MQPSFDSLGQSVTANEVIDLLAVKPNATDPMQPKQLMTAVSVFAVFALNLANVPGTQASEMSHIAQFDMTPQSLQPSDVDTDQFSDTGRLINQPKLVIPTKSADPKSNKVKGCRPKQIYQNGRTILIQRCLWRQDFQPDYYPSHDRQIPYSIYQPIV